MDNVWFEERVNASRQEAFEAEVGDVDTWENLRKQHESYYNTFVSVAAGLGLLPDTFVAGYVVRDLSRIDEDQKVVRIESIARPLSKSPPLSFARLQETLVKGEDSLIDDFLRTWNGMRDARPAFATLKSAAVDDLERTDWPERLRDRLGLAHYDVADGPEPVALMEYRVEEIAEATRSTNAACAVTAPTVLDSIPSPHFFPAPTELDCGRAMALFEIDDDEDLAVELLHVRLTCRREHVVRLGEIRRPPGKLALTRLRNHHLSALRLASGRDEFGEEMPAHGTGTA